MDNIRLDELPLTLTNKQFAQAAGISQSRWYQLRQAKVFDGLESGIDGRWSTEKVREFLTNWSRSRRPRRVA